MTADEWNQQYLVGTWVRYRENPHTEPEVTVTRTPAWTLGDGTPVVSIAGRGGGVALSHVTPLVGSRPLGEFELLESIVVKLLATDGINVVDAAGRGHTPGGAVGAGVILSEIEGEAVERLMDRVLGVTGEGA